MNKYISITIAVLVVIAGIYWLSTMNPANSTTDQTSGESDITVTDKGPVGVASGPNGDYLVDKRGLTLYVNLDDEEQDGEDIQASCDAACEETWAPLLLGADEFGLTASEDAVLSKLNLIERADGKQQYAIGNQPLYTSVYDKALGEVKGDLSDNWMVAKP